MPALCKKPEACEMADCTAKGCDCYPKHALDTMPEERYYYLEKHHLSKLTPEEVEAGYRFCCEWDGLLIHGSHPEADCCSCLREWRYEQEIEQRPIQEEQSKVGEQSPYTSIQDSLSVDDLLG